MQDHLTRDQKVKRVQITGLVCTALTITELIVRAFAKDYVIGHIIFVAELLLVASFMLYYTMRFSALVTEVQKCFGINFIDEKNQLRCSLGVFLFSYFLRALLKGLTIGFS
jgi:cobalamin biosynthesis protein CobD/CbiB